MSKTYYNSQSLWIALQYKFEKLGRRKVENQGEKVSWKITKQKSKKQKAKKRIKIHKKTRKKNKELQKEKLQKRKANIGKKKSAYLYKILSLAEKKAGNSWPIK